MLIDIDAFKGTILTISTFSLESSYFLFVPWCPLVYVMEIFSDKRMRSAWYTQASNSVCGLSVQYSFFTKSDNWLTKISLSYVEVNWVLSLEERMIAYKYWNKNEGIEAKKSVLWNQLVSVQERWDYILILCAFYRYVR